MKTSVIPDAYGYHGVKDNFLTNNYKNRFHWIIVNEALVELRKWSIDVDGLIEAGLAMDKTTM